MWGPLPLGAPRACLTLRARTATVRAVRLPVLRVCAAAVLLLVLLVTALAACSTGPAAQQSYCVNGAGQVQPDWHCSGSDPLYWYWLGAFTSPYRVGQVIHVTNVHVTRVESTDRAARTRYGMPATGTVRSGSTVRTSTRQTTVRSSTVRSSTVRSSTVRSSVRGGRR